MTKDKMVVNNIGGKKADCNKLDWTLMPWGVLKIVVKVLMFGAKKYDRENWKKVEIDRYKKALLRHVLTDEWLDEETKLPHLAHAVCCALFIMYLKLESPGLRAQSIEDRRQNGSNHKRKDFAG